MPRNTKLTPPVHEAIVKKVKAGSYPEVAAVACGIGARTFYKWMARGKRGRSGIYRQFWADVKKAEAEAETRNIIIIEMAAKKTWQAAAWYLERKHASRWARVDALLAKELKDEIKALKNAIAAGKPENTDASAKEANGSLPASSGGEGGSDPPEAPPA